MSLREIPPRDVTDRYVDTKNELDFRRRRDGAPTFDRWVRVTVKKDGVVYE